MQSPKLTVGIVTAHNCIRAHKQALLLGDMGYKVVLFSSELQNSHHPWYAFDAAVKLFKGDNGAYQSWQVKRAFETMEPMIDVWHCHNEPDWLIPLVRQVSDKPIVYDIHDMKSQRTGVIEEDEKQSLEMCQAVSVVSRRYQEIVISRDPLKPVKEVLSCLPRDWIPKNPPHVKRGGLVYEGGLGHPGTQEFPCRNWSQVFGEIHKLGIQVWAYSASPAVSPEMYPTTILRTSVNFMHMIQELQMYEFGLVGSPVPDPMFDGALPNKMFEYMAAGLPMICMNAPDAGRFLQATGMGVVVRDVKDIPDAMQQMRDQGFEEVVKHHRWNWVAEDQIPKIIWLYEKATGKTLVDPIVPGETVCTERKIPQTTL